MSLRLAGSRDPCAARRAGPNANPNTKELQHKEPAALDIYLKSPTHKEPDRRMASVLANERAEALLTLSELSNIVSCETFHWLSEEEEQAEIKRQQHLLECSAPLDLLFGGEEEEEEAHATVQEWTSSELSVDGSSACDGFKRSVAQIEDGSVTVKFVYGSSATGHGDQVWAASRHIANLLASASKCAQLLEPMLGSWDATSGQHPLKQLRMAELGAGCGLPSWVGMARGAQVTVTDLRNTDRIRSLAVSAEVNSRHCEACSGQRPVVRVAPHTWGEAVSDLVEWTPDGAGEESGLYDVVIAADCLYMPGCHEVLLTSCAALLKPNGMIFLPFALHGNTDDENVWSIVPKAEQSGFRVTQLVPEQLTPQADNMGAKRALVHTIVLQRQAPVRQRS